MRQYDDSKIRAASASVKRGLKKLGLVVSTDRDDIYRTCETTSSAGRTRTARGDGLDATTS